MNKEEARIAVFSSYDVIGGAALSCYYLVKQLRLKGYEAIEVVSSKSISDEFVYPVKHFTKRKPYPVRLVTKWINKVIPQEDQKKLSEGTDPKYCFFDDDSYYPEMNTIEDFEKNLPFIPNIIIVGHTYGLVNLETLALMHKKWGANIYLTCVDIGAYTGGCHVHWDCRGFENGCKNCPATNSIEKKEEIAQAFSRKEKFIKEGSIGIRYANNWLRNEIVASGLFDGQGQLLSSQMTDTNLYNPFNRDVAKRIFGIPITHRAIMAGSTYLNEERKGIVYFVEALVELWQQMDEQNRRTTTIILVGSNSEEIKELVKRIPPFQVKIIDYIKDERYLSLLYQAVDVFVCTSLEDAGPMMVTDAMSCGTPVVGFRTGFLADYEICKDFQTGFSVESRDSKGIADGIYKILNMDGSNYAKMSNKCREIAVEKLSVDYSLRLFEDMVSII